MGIYSLRCNSSRLLAWPPRNLMSADKEPGNETLINSQTDRVAVLEGCRRHTPL